MHIQAPCGRRDDLKFLDLAQSIVNFEPISTTSISTEKSASSDQNANLSTAIELTQLQRSDLEATDTRSSPPLNPLYKSNFRTPTQFKRPRTAPELGIATIQVPRSWPGRRRSLSDAASFASLASHVSDSQPSGSFTDNPSNHVDSGPDEAFIEMLSQASFNEEEPRRKRRKTLESEALSSGSERAPRAEVPLIEDAPLSWTSPLQSREVISNPSSTTATPSQPVSGLDEQDVLVHESQRPVILISSSSSGRSKKAGGIESLRHPETETDHSEEPGEIVQCQFAESSSQSERNDSVFNLFELEREVAAPQPNVGEEKFVTHITKHLGDMAANLPFNQFFRPVRVERDVRVQERGYWLMEIGLVPEAVARSLREATSPVTRMQERFEGATAAERWAKYDEARRNGTLHQSGQNTEAKAQGCWTEDEFCKFWKRFTSFIETGRAGWGLRLAGEDMSKQSGIDRGVRVKIFTWGETLAHVYLALWVLSDKLLARIPMAWVSSDGSHIIQMSGTRSGRGNLPSWRRKDNGNGDSCWGIGREA